MKKTNNFCFKILGCNLEFIDKGNLFIEIKPIHKPKNTRHTNINKLGKSL